MEKEAQFQLGDVVKVYNAYGECYGTSTVVGFTPTGRIRIDNKAYGLFYPNGDSCQASSPGYGRGWIEKDIS